MIKENGIDKIDLLKIDVEGDELEVLKGIHKHDWELIRQFVIEVHNTKAYMQQLIELLEERGLKPSIEAGTTDSLGNANLYCICE